MKPFNGTEIIVTTDHFPVGDLITQAVSGLVRINIHVTQIWRADAPVSLALRTFLPSLPGPRGRWRPRAGLVGLQVGGGFDFLLSVRKFQSC